MIVATLNDFRHFLTSSLGRFDPLPFRRTDWGSNGTPFYQVSDCALDPAGFIIQTFSFAPFGSFVLSHGDGGQYFTPFPSSLGNRWVVAGTQDSGTPMQYFVGPEYGGTGWIAIGTDVTTSWWTTVTGHTADAASPDAKPPLGSQAMRYVKQFATLPFTFFGGPVIPITVEAVVTEVYDGPGGPGDVNSAMERAFYCAGWGCLRWEAWRNDGTSPDADIAQRAPLVLDNTSGDYWGPPAPGWVLVDGRMWTNVIAVNDPRLAGTVRSVSDFGWP
jgi:hypothetical protein